MNSNEPPLSPENRQDIETLWNFHVIDSGPATGDVLLVLGSHDIRVADRAAELFLSERAAPLVMVTGGSGKITKTEWPRPEAEVYAERLVRAGVPDGVILIEGRATNTGDNFVFSKRVLREHGITVAKGIVVCKPYMARRSLAVAHKRWPEATWRTRPPRIALWDYPAEDVPFKRMINLMVGDLQRLKIYAEEGFQAPVHIPPEVWTAYERLAADGFDDFVIG